MKNNFSEEIPDKLYKYMPWRVDEKTGRNYTKELLENNQFYLSPASNFNDPFDCKFYVAVDKTFEKLLQVENKMELIQKTEAILNEDIQDFRKRAYITCFSSENTNLLMWSHYSDKHSGVCLEFENRYNRLEVLPVEYERTYSVVKISDYQKLMRDMIENNDEKAFWVDFAKSLFLKKHQQWKYEKEYRIIRFNNNWQEKGLFLSFYPSLITEIICGCRMENETILQVKDFMKEQGLDIPVKRAKTKEKEYGLDII
jgi:hypothetical protein